MRLTLPLFRQHLGWHFKLRWKIAAKRKIGMVRYPPVFEERGIKVVDAKEYLRSESDLKWENHRPPTLPEPFGPDIYASTGPEHPHWKEKEIYHFKRNSKLVEGIPQICVLTKTIKYDFLPQSLNNLEGVVSLPNQDEIVKNHIMCSNVWDGTQIRLPKKLDITRPGHVFPREYGIPYFRKVWTLQQNLINLSNMATGKYDSWKRTNIVRPLARVFCDKEGDTILFEIKGDTAVYSDKPLPPVGKKEQTLDEKLPDIFPLRHTIDVPKTNIYQSEELYPISANFRNVHVHTIHISHNMIFYWHQPQKVTRAIAACFTFATSQAHLLYGTKVKDLPIPITVQGVFIDLNTVGFVVYQLNTLNLDSTEGIKNQVWVNGPHQLFKECNEDSGVVDYDPSVIRKLFALHVNGLHVPV